MKINTVSTIIVFFTASLAVGCDPAAKANPAIPLAQARAAIAFAEAELEREPKPPTPKPPTPPGPTPDAPTTCDDCRGTGTVPSGDGLARVPCPCGAACRCEPRAGAAANPEPSPRRKRLLYFAADWCTHCRRDDAALESLKKAGWLVGPGPENHVQRIDFDRDAAVRSRYGVTGVPTWILVDDGKELRRSHGVLDAAAIGRLFSTR